MNDCVYICVSCQLRTDAEKSSLVESGLAWYSEDKALQKADSGAYDTGSLKTESSSKYRKSRPAEGAALEKTARRELKKPQSLGQPTSFKKGQNPPVGVTSPITHTSQSMLRVAGEKVEMHFILLELSAVLQLHVAMYTPTHTHTHLHHCCIPFQHQSVSPHVLMIEMPNLKYNKHAYLLSCRQESTTAYLCYFTVFS